MQWAGNSLIDTGLLVCRSCLDVPQDQYRTVILPADPMPIVNARPSPNTTPVPARAGLPLTVTPENQGFTQYVLGSSTFLSGTAPPTQAGVLARVAAMSGVATPSFPGLVSYVVPVLPGNRTVTLVPPNGSRSFLLLFNPTQVPAQVSLGIATQGAITNLSIGPNEAYFWSTAQGLSPVYQGGITAVGIFAPLDLWAWEDGSNLIDLYDDDGLLALTSHPLDYPTDPTGLPPGSVWDNGLSVSVVGPITPSPLAPPVFFGSVTAASLLALGGANLPLTNPGVPNQLWYNGDSSGGWITVS